MNDNMMVDMDPLNSYESHYNYPLPNPHYYTHLPPLIPFPHKDNQTPMYTHKNETTTTFNDPQIQTLPETHDNCQISNVTDAADQTADVQEDIKPDITKEEKQTRKKKLKGKTSSYWNKKITDKDFAFYGCSICNIAYKEIHELDQHVIIHSNRMTSYDLRLINLKKRKRLKKIKKKQKNSKVKLEVDIDIKPEDGYIGTEKTTDFNNDKKPEKDVAKENNPVNCKSDNDNYINAYKCFGCDKQFALSYYLKIHVRSHTDEKPYTCMECGQSFITASKLGRHNKRIHLAVRNQCRICYRYFNRFELLVKHFDKKHADDKLDGEPYDYNAILPYIKELEEQSRLQKEEKPKAEDPWDLPLGSDTASQDKMVLKTKENENLGVTEDLGARRDDLGATEEGVSEEEVHLSADIFDDCKDEVEMDRLPDTNIIIEEVKVGWDIKEECFDEDVMKNDAAISDGDDMMKDDDDVKDEKDSGSDEEYFPSETWVRPPSPLPSPPPVPKRRYRSTTCEICNKKLSSKAYMTVHMRTHTGEKPFSCYICGRGFITASKMHRHVLTHDESWEGKDAVKPEEDGEVKTEESTEEASVKKKKSKVDKAKSKLLLKKSKKTFFEKKEKKSKKWTHCCEYCNQKFLHLETLQVHMKSHPDSSPALCHFCLEPGGAAHAHTGPRPYLCTACGATYKKRGALMYHRKNRCNPNGSDGKTFICDICQKSYNAQFKLQRHMITHSVSKFTYRYECPVCAHMFHTRYHVQMHLRSHMKEGLIQEDNRNAILAMVLQNARKIPKTPETAVPALTDDATDERSRICNICGQIFQHFYYLEEHLKTHGSKIAIQDLDKEEEKKHVCQVCSKSFKLHYYLKLHSYTHTKEKPYICQQCGKGFITKGKLKRHIETHQGLKKYQCHICYKFFTRPSYMRIHVRTIHGTQDYNFRDYGIGVPIGTINRDENC